jgi:glutathione peroxidase
MHIPKVEVNGPGTHPVYQHFKSVFPGDVKWNFGKFLVDKTGHVVKRYSHSDKPESIAKDIIALL